MTRTFKFVLFALIVLIALPVSAQVDAKACTGIDPTKGVPDNCIALMNAFPNPTVTKVRRDGYTINNYSFWKVQVVDAPVLTELSAPALATIEWGAYFVDTPALNDAEIATFTNQAGATLGCAGEFVDCGCLWQIPDGVTQGCPEAWSGGSAGARSRGWRRGGSGTATSWSPTTRTTPRGAATSSRRCAGGRTAWTCSSAVSRRGAGA